DAAKAPFTNTFKLLLAQRPGAFNWKTSLVHLPQIAVQWTSVFAGVGVVRIALGDQPAWRAIFLSGVQPESERAVIQGERDSIASHPGTTFHAAFAAFLADPERPLIAA